MQEGVVEFIKAGDAAKDSTDLKAALSKLPEKTPSHPVLAKEVERAHGAMDSC